MYVIDVYKHIIHFRIIIAGYVTMMLYNDFFSHSNTQIINDMEETKKKKKKKHYSYD